MSEKLPSLEELMNLAAEKGIELPDDIEAAGGVYTQEEWYAMSTEERKAAQMRSMIARMITHQVCELDPGVDPHNMP